MKKGMRILNHVPWRTISVGGFLLVFFLVVPYSVFAATYYVSPTGDDSNSGTSPTEAWQTMDRVNEGIFTGGDSVLFEGGATFTEPLLIASTSEDIYDNETAKVTGYFGKSTRAFVNETP